MLFTTGSTEAKQLMKLLNHSSLGDTFISEWNTKIKVNFSVNTLITHDCCAIIRLVDNSCQTANVSRLLPQGGSSFRSVVVNERRLYSCPFIDYFNGTYDVVCRLYDECHNVSIVLDYLDYSAFRWDSKLMEQLLFVGNICRQHNTKHFYDPYIGWYRNNSKDPWRWVRGEKDVMTDDQLRSCIAKLPSPMFFIGDSHLRYTLYYWLLLENKLTTDMAKKNLHVPFTIDKFAMLFATFTLSESEIPAYRCVRFFLVI